MKKILALLFFITALSAQAQHPQEQPVVDSIKVSGKLIKKIEKGEILLIDVRTPEEYKAGHLKYSSNIDYKNEQFKTETEKLDKNKTVYVYCRSGNRSSKSAEILKAQGFKHVYNIGGLEYLKKLGLPAE
ncbi:MAG TPA: rhodanese-like domain-containing protein [Cytophagaceae bacterium]|jgi:phage shock protein E|nr:rhodanese-like domain-containing protein [Cytophagaceae bacterium]